MIIPGKNMYVIAATDKSRGNRLIFGSTSWEILHLYMVINYLSI